MLNLRDLYKTKKDDVAETLEKRNPSSEIYKLIGFRLSDEEFVIEIDHVKEIVRVPLITRVSHAPNFVEGIANLRGDILQIVNFHTLMGLENSPITDKSRVVVLDDKQTLAGILVDSVSEVIEVEKEAVQPIPDMIAAEKTKFLKGIIKPHRHRNILWLDSSSLYSESFLQNKKTLVG